MKKDVSLTIDGMHCDHCAANLERELKLVPGVKKASVSFADKTASVTYDEGKTDLDALSAAVSGAGYRVV